MPKLANCYQQQQEQIKAVPLFRVKAPLYAEFFIS